MTNHLDIILCANCANDVNYYDETCLYCGEMTDFKAPKLRLDPTAIKLVKPIFKQHYFSSFCRKLMLVNPKREIEFKLGILNSMRKRSARER